MLFRILKSNQPIVIFFFFAFCILQWINSFIDPNVFYFLFDSHATPLYSSLFSFFSEKKILSILISFIILFIEALLLIRLNTKYIFIASRTYLPGLIFFLIAGSYIELQRFHPTIFANIFVIAAIDRLFASFKKNIALNKIFDAAFFISIASLFYTNLIFFIIIIWIGTAILKQFYWREWLISIIGFVFPYFFLAAIYFLSGKNITLIFNNIIDNIVFKNSIIYINTYYKIYLWFILFLTIIASYHMLSVFQSKKISSRKYLLIFWWMFVLIVVMFFILPSASVELIPLLAIPLSYIFSHFFTISKSSWRIQFLFYIFLISTIILQKFV